MDCSTLPCSFAVHCEIMAERDQNGTCYNWEKESTPLITLNTGSLDFPVKSCYCLPRNTYKMLQELVRLDDSMLVIQVARTSSADSPAIDDSEPWTSDDGSDQRERGCLHKGLRRINT